MNPEKYVLQSEIGQNRPTEAELIAEIRGLFDAYIRSGCDKEKTIECLAGEYSATLVRKALTGHKTPSVSS